MRHTFVPSFMPSAGAALTILSHRNKSSLRSTQSLAALPRVSLLAKELQNRDPAEDVAHKLVCRLPGRVFIVRAASIRRVSADEHKERLVTFRVRLEPAPTHERAALLGSKSPDVLHEKRIAREDLLELGVLRVLRDVLEVSQRCILRRSQTTSTNDKPNRAEKHTRTSRHGVPALSRAAVLQCRGQVAHVLA